MTMTKKKIIIAVGVAVILAFVALRVVNYMTYKAEEHYLKRHYIFDKGFPGNRNKPASPSSSYLSDGIATAKTLDLFRFLEQRFAVQSVEQLHEHFSKVKKYLHSQFKESEARRLFEIYKKYLKCEIELGNNPKYRAKTSEPKLILMLLYKIQNVRRARLGKGTADALFGMDVKEREYLLRRSLIIDDSTLCGKEKESGLQGLKYDMWDGEVISIGEDNNPYNRYQLKLLLYQKDLSELSEGKRTNKIEEFRKEFFSKEQVKRLREVDDQIAREKENMARYRVAEKEILDSRKITEEEKDKRIKALQEKFFGKDAEAFRRREIMYRGAEK